MKSLHVWACVSVVGVLSMAGCKSGGQQGGSDGGVGPLAGVLEGFGDVGRGAAGALRFGEAMHRAGEKFTGEEEYYIGRMAAAKLVGQYKLYNDDSANRYLNLVGKTLAEFSTKPQVFAGYNFHAIDSDEINAFAAPGAFILVTRGLLRCAENEDELAAILAHEIAHVQNEHALAAISESRKNDVFVVAGKEIAGGLTSGQSTEQLVKLLSPSIEDMFKTLTISGYSQGQEAQADTDAVAILRLTGYDPHAFVAMLEKMKSRIKHDAHDFASTHPKPDDRIATVKKAIGGQVPVAIDPVRVQRFNDALKAARAE